MQIRNITQSIINTILMLLLTNVHISVVCLNYYNILFISYCEDLSKRWTPKIQYKTAISSYKAICFSYTISITYSLSRSLTDKR